MFLYQTLYHLLLSGITAFSLILVLFIGGKIFPVFIWLIFLQPGMEIATLVVKLFPLDRISLLIQDTEDTPLLFANLSIVFACLFWWICFFIALKSAFLLTNKLIEKSKNK